MGCINIFLFGHDGFDLCLPVDVVDAEIDCLANETGINPTLNKQLYAIGVDSRESVVAALFVDYYSDTFDFDVMVSPAWQGQGVGRALIKEALSLFYGLQATVGGITAEIRVLHPAVRMHLYRAGFIPKHTDNTMEDVIMTHQDDNNTEKRLETFTALITPSMEFFQREIKPLLVSSGVTMGELDATLKKAAASEPLKDIEARLLATLAMNQPRKRWEREALLTAIRENSELPVTLPLNQQPQFDQFVAKNAEQAKSVFTNTQSAFLLSDEALEKTIKQAYTLLGNGSIPVFSSEEMAPVLHLTTQLSHHIDIADVVNNLQNTLHQPQLSVMVRNLSNKAKCNVSEPAPEPAYSPSLKP